MGRIEDTAYFHLDPEKDRKSYRQVKIYLSRYDQIQYETGIKNYLYVHIM